jgi:2-phosphosulfolactate phosphatase
VGIFNLPLSTYEKFHCRWTIAQGQAYTEAMASLKVHFLPRWVSPDQLAGGTCVVIDVLRATTTIAYALERGATAVLPCLEIADARQLAASLPAGTFLLGGERGGKRIEGFDLGNSPAEYTPDRVASKSIVFTTTNGTRAMHHCHRAREILLGSLVNAQAISQALARRDDVHFICAGTDGEITREDVVAAGAMASMLTSTKEFADCNDEALVAIDAWRSVGLAAAGSQQAFGNLSAMLANSLGGRNLIEIGMQADIALAADVSSLPVVPIYRDGCITLLSETV